MINRLIYGVALAPFVKKVMLVCDYKKLAYHQVPIIPPIKMTDHFLKISPLKKIPILEEDDFNIADSSVIAAYLEKEYPQYPLYPQDSKMMAKALWIEEYADTALNEICGHQIFVQQIVRPKVLKKPAERNLQDDVDLLPPLFNYLETFLCLNKRKMIVGDHISIADIALAVQFICLEHCGIKIDANQWPYLSAYVRLLLSEPLINNSIQNDRALLTKC